MQEDKKESKRKRVVVEEVESPVSSEVLSSNEIQKDKPEPKILEEGIKTDSGNVIPNERLPLSTPKNSFVVWWIIIPGIFLLGALLGGIVFYQKGINKGENLTSTPVPTISETAQSPSPTPVSRIDLSKFSINVLNGSGISGEAGRAKDLLTSAGFKVSGTGNASSYNFTKTVIKAKANVDSEFLTKLAETLSKNYLLDKNQTLSDSSSDEVQVVVGSTKAPQ